MSWALATSTTASSYTAGDVTTGSINVTAGDLIVVAGMTIASAKTVDGISDSNSNSYTLRTQLDESDATLRHGYAVAANTTSLTITVDFTASEQWARVNVYVFRPDSGETVSLDTSGTVTSAWTATGTDAITTSEGTSTGSDLVALATVVSGGGSSTFANEEMPIGTAVDGGIGANPNTETHYKLHTSQQSGIEFQCDLATAGGSIVAEMLVFKSEAGAGGSVPVILQQHE